MLVLYFEDQERKKEALEKWISSQTVCWNSWRQGRNRTIEKYPVTKMTGGYDETR
jgi:hypothetical protein